MDSTNNWRNEMITVAEVQKELALWRAERDRYRHALAEIRDDPDGDSLRMADTADKALAPETKDQK